MKSEVVTVTAVISNRRKTQTALGWTSVNGFPPRFCLYKKNRETGGMTIISLADDETLKLRDALTAIIDAGALTYEDMNFRILEEE